MIYIPTDQNKGAYKRFKRVNRFIYNRKTLFLAFFIVFGLFLNSNIVKAEDLSAWTNRLPITIDNTSNSNELIDFEVDVVIGFRAEMNNDFSDIRFTDSDEITLLNFGWEIDDDGEKIKENGISATAVVKIPTIPANNTKTIYVYYGNLSATSVANLETALTWFDHFTTNRNAEYDELEGNWIWRTVDSRIYAQISYSQLSPKNLLMKNFRYRARYESGQVGTWSSQHYHRFLDWDNWYLFWWSQTSQIRFQSKLDGASSIHIADPKTPEAIYYTHKINWYENEYEFGMTGGSVDWSETGTNDLINQSGKFLIQGYGNYYWDYIYIRKNTKPLPTAEITEIPPTAELQPLPTITSPTQAQEIIGNIVTAQGECWFIGVDIIDKDTGQRFWATCHYPINSFNPDYHFQDPIDLEYLTETGRPAGYVEFSVPAGYFAGLIRQDANDVKIVRYNDEFGFWYDELDYWFGTVDTDTIFKFYVVDEPAGRTKPVNDYYLLYGHIFEDISPTIIPDEPTTTYYATRGDTQLLKGSYSIDFYRDLGEHTITAQSFIDFPQLIYSIESDPVTFTLLETAIPPVYSWTEPILWYGEVSKFEQPTLFLAFIFDLAEGTLEPLMAQINKFTQFFNTEQAGQDALLITNAMKTVISYTRVFDNFFGSLPVSWALILLMIVYIAKFIIIYTAKAIQVFKPM